MNSVLILLLSLYGLSLSNAIALMDDFNEGENHHRIHKVRPKRSFYEKIPFWNSASSSLSSSSSSSSSCPADCVEKGANGVCDQDCNRPVCINDFSDCSIDRECDPYTCPDDGQCIFECEMNGCNKGSCSLLEEGKKQFALIDFSSDSPHKFYSFFVKGEAFLNHRLKLTVSLQGDHKGPLVWGRSKKTNELVRMRWRGWSEGNLEEIQGDVEIGEGCLALFSLESQDIIDYKNTTIINALSRFATKKNRGKVSLLVLSAEERKNLITDTIERVRIPRQYEMWSAMAAKKEKTHLPTPSMHYKKPQVNHPVVYFSCPVDCVEKGANGQCNAECSPTDCLNDFSDCAIERECDPFTCPDDGQCRWNCELNGCHTGSCSLLEEGKKQFYLIDISSVTPQKVYAIFYKGEQFMNEKLGFEIRLQGDSAGPLIWGRDSEANKLVRMRFAKGDIQKIESDEELTEGCLALFSLESPDVIDYENTTIMQALSRFGHKKVVGKVSLLILSANESKNINSIYLDQVRDGRAVKEFRMPKAWRRYAAKVQKGRGRRDLEAIRDDVFE